MENQVNLDSSKFDELLRCLLILKDNCNDADIREGFIRQRSNDNSTVFEIDLTHIISNMSLSITELKTKTDGLKVFSGQEVTITSTDENFIISSQNYDWKIKRIPLEYMDNKYISSEELSKIIVLNQEDLILKYSIPKTMSDTIRVISSIFHTNSIRANFDNDKASFNSSDQSKNNHFLIAKDVLINKELNHSSNLVITPFIIDHDGDIDFQMYESGTNIIINLFSTTIGSTNMNLYTRASLIENE